MSASLQNLPKHSDVLAEMARRGLLSGGPAPTFRGAALTLQTAYEPELIISGPWETGKTFSALWRLDERLRDTPKASALMIRKKRVDMDASCIQTYKKIIERRGGVTIYGGETARWFDYSNGARLWMVGLDNPGKALSAEFDYIYVNQAEELELADWETLTGRCTGRAGNTDTPQIIGDCNPGPEDHWILKRTAAGSLTLLKSYHRDNPRLYNEDGTLTPEGERSMNVLNALTGIRRKRGRDGEWVGAEGLFFEEWDEELHTCEPFDIPGDWPVWGAFDEGFTHPLAFGLLTEDNDGTIYLIGEHVRHGWLPPAHCKAIRRLAERCEVSWDRVKKIAAGHDVFQVRGDKEGKTRQQQYIEAVDPETDEPIGIGKKFVKATLDRRTGAQELLSRLGNREAGIKPRLKIFNICKRTIATITRMVHDPSDPEDVLKVDAVNGEGGDDPYDMLRYGVMVKKGGKGVFV
ncbi:MAG TPA: phage terminase large subunit [Pyrinomonadaceae bacterium]